MSGIVILTLLVLAITAVLELGHRRHADPTRTGLQGGWTRDDRDLARTKLDLDVLGSTEPPAESSPAAALLTIRGSRRTMRHHSRAA